MAVRTANQALQFLRDFGAFSVNGDQDGWTLEELFTWQEYFGGLAQRDPRKWSTFMHRFLNEHVQRSPIDWIESLLMGTNHRLEFQWNKLPQAEWAGTDRLAIIRTLNVTTAITASLHVDHLRGWRFGVCAREDCPKFYQIASEHARKYCGQYCAHLESVRRTRAKQRQQTTVTARAANRLSRKKQNANGST